MKKRDEFVFKIHGDPSRWHVTVCYALLRSVKVYCNSHVLPRSPKIWCPIVTSVAKFLTVKNFATLVTINTIHSRPLAITTIPVYVLSRLPRFFPIVVIVAIVAQCKPSITTTMASITTTMASIDKQRDKGVWNNQRHALKWTICWELSYTCFVTSWSGRQRSK